MEELLDCSAGPVCQLDLSLIMRGREDVHEPRSLEQDAERLEDEPSQRAVSFSISEVRWRKRRNVQVELSVGSERDAERDGDDGYGGTFVELV